MKDNFIRDGFEDCLVPNRTLNRLATLAMKKRLKQHSKLPLISTMLLKNRLPMAIGAYKTRDNQRYCVLGVIAKKINALGNDGIPEWYRIFSRYNCTEAELHRHVECPVDGCWHSNLIISILPHLNDKHEWGSKRIGKWLKEYRL
jgi:hypothetical protein